jgi:hypothetical protein
LFTLNWSNLMATIPSQSPQRLPAGSTTDPPYGPWADNGNGNSFFYHQFADDFDNALGIAGLYTLSGTGSAVHTPGDGGLALLSTLATTPTFASIQLPAASFTLPQGALAGKKLFWGARIALSDIAASVLIAGLINTTATPFTAITDGIWFSKASGGTQLVLNVASGGTTKSFNVATNTYTLVNATNIDLAFYVDRYGNIQYSVGAQLFGWFPQSGTGASTPANSYPSLPVLCPTGKLYSGNQPTTVATGYTLSTANLNMTLAIQNGAAAIKTLTADFHGAAKER